MDKETNKIVKRVYYAIEISLRSPLAISNGEDELTAKDVLRNSKGETFIPGTSIAGAFRNYLEKEKHQPCNFGFSQGEEGRMSSINIYDVYFDKEPVVTVRDGVQLSEDKQVENKFDMEALETGATGIIYLNYVIRENDCTINTDAEMAQLLQAMERGEIRFGGNKNKGFGRVAIERIFQQPFTKDYVKEWVAFSPKFRDVSKYSIRKKYGEWIQGCSLNEEKYYIFKVPLKLKGGISIRKYSAEPKKADFEHITCNGEPIIPGTSWNGAIRADVKNILRQLGCESSRITQLIAQWFGYVNTDKGRRKENKKKKQLDAKQSLAVFGESVIRGSVRMPIIRNKINRFDSSTIESALYSEIVNYGGETELEVMVRKDESCGYRALLAVLELAVKDICKGYVAVGGQVSVGRGIFYGSSESVLDEETRSAGQKELLEIIGKV